ncbi:preprotein translocase subunit SecE [Mycobacterium sp.]|uniref:preprotein translocase subunit SecE n=1 Tax=Mycobacterium sp. TaxID=1785 RepID=UPI003A8764D7
MSDEGDIADDAASDGGDTGGNRDSETRAVVATETVPRPQRPTGKRSRQRAAESDQGDAAESEAAGQQGASKSASDSPSGAGKKAKADKARKSGKKSKKADSSSVLSPFVFVYNYLKQVVAEMRKVIWPNRKQMLTYTSVVLVFLVFMVALVAGADVGLSKLVLLVFG